MNLALDCFVDNPIIDELVCWPPRRCKISSIRASSALFRRPFIEVELSDGEVFQRHFERHSFAHDWSEARIVLETLTDIELISEFAVDPLEERDALIEDVLTQRDACIEESYKMYDNGMYAQFLMQFGEDYKNLPAETEARIAEARRRLLAAD